MATESAAEPRFFLKKGSALDTSFVTGFDSDDDEAFRRIRCPLCAWQPTPASLWFCIGIGTPEPSFRGCGALWNTFRTRGRCPRCEHQWQWTSCLQCAGWSLHEDWYEETGSQS
jgi:hypothetical protein